MRSSRRETKFAPAPALATPQVPFVWAARTWDRSGAGEFFRVSEQPTSTLKPQPDTGRSNEIRPGAKTNTHTMQLAQLPLPPRGFRAEINVFHKRSSYVFLATAENGPFYVVPVKHLSCPG